MVEAGDSQTVYWDETWTKDDVFPTPVHLGSFLGNLEKQMNSAHVS